MFDNQNSTRCTFHIFTQEWSKITNFSENDRILMKHMKDWICSWIYEIHYPWDLHDSMDKFKRFLETYSEKPWYDKVSEVFNRLCRTKSKWAKCYKTQALDLLYTTTSPGEAYNASLKSYGEKAVLSKSSIGKTASVCIEHTKSLSKKSNKIGNSALIKHSPTFIMKDQHVITTKCLSKVSSLKEKASLYDAFNLSETTILVCENQDRKRKCKFE